MLITRPNPSPVRSGAGLHLGPSEKQDRGLEYVYLQEYFGFEDFRPGQEEVVKAVLSKKDAAVFWATGAGKSLCYQLPALQSGKMAIVISPLISLMQDQVNKFNATVGAGQGNHRACYLGSAQFDAGVEQDVLRAGYRLVYMTPEKATGQFLHHLKKLHSDAKLSLLAVDEAHCISEWGHDFRPSFRALREVRAALPGLPFMALTATAVPRVQQDIIEQLSLGKDACVSLSSVDRKNLQIACSRKTSRGADLERMAKDIISKRGSTIVYVPTQNETDNVASFLKDRLAPISVSSYHGGRSPGDREAAHLDFLSGKAEVIVATIAFGMGIDKPDIRRIIHYGPPKTVEEYFQQIGRAGRDGLTSACELIAADNDFNNYGSDFYTQGLNEQCKRQMLASVEALRRYASEACCRRSWLIKYFGEKPSFESCGNCDFCMACSKNAGDSHRNFWPVACPILMAVASTSSFPMAQTKLLEILAGRAPDFASRAVTEAIPKIQDLLVRLPKIMRSQAFLKEMISLLCNAGYLSRQQKSLETASGYTNRYEVYVLSEKGNTALRGGNSDLQLPVPPGIRQHEEKEAQKLAAKVKELKDAGYDPEKMSKEELENDDNKLLWYVRKLKGWRESGSESLIKRADNHDELQRRILEWRAAAAVKLQMAPAAVFAEHLAATISYCKPTNVDDLRSIGVRIAGIEELAKLIAIAKAELFTDEDEQPSSEPVKRAAQLCLPEGAWKAPKRWSGLKPARGKAKPAWEASYERFAKGETIMAIAAGQAGKPIQPGTVINHVLTALLHALPVDLARLANQCDRPLPDQAEWQKLEDAASERGCDPNSDFVRKEFLAAVLGESVNREHTEKTEAEKRVEGEWYSRIDWWAAFKRAGIPVKFGEENDSKRQRLA
mmetsp:Transcript_93429/g.166238  ORF Transcript_93429/g.166238 Transcript_93429/m.166238 type:complete len:894 (+) Transcript_93429:119-2800(+)